MDAKTRFFIRTRKFKVTMKSYVYILRVTYKNGDHISSNIQTGQVFCENFHRAVELALDTESMNWDEKRAGRELISLICTTP